MPCICGDHCRFLPHFSPGPMRCEFSPELVPPLPHAMMRAFPRSESETLHGSPTSPLSPLTPTGFSLQLIPKPPGEVTHVGRGGYRLKDILEQHGWKDGLYDKIRVFATCSHVSVILKPFFRNGFTRWPTNIWIRRLLIPLKLRITLSLSVRWCNIQYLFPHGYAIYHTPGIQGIPHPP